MQRSDDRCPWVHVCGQKIRLSDKSIYQRGFTGFNLTNHRDTGFESFQLTCEPRDTAARVFIARFTDTAQRLPYFPGGCFEFTKLIKAGRKQACVQERFCLRWRGCVHFTPPAIRPGMTN